MYVPTRGDIKAVCVAWEMGEAQGAYGPARPRISNLDFDLDFDAWRQVSYLSCPMVLFFVEEEKGEVKHW